MKENNKMDISRRGFLKTAALAGANGHAFGIGQGIRFRDETSENIRYEYRCSPHQGTSCIGYG